MKKQFTWFGVIAAIIISLSTFFVGCNKDDLNDVVEYHGQVVYINTTTPFPDLTVKVTNGKDTHCQTQTDAGGLFSLKVRVNEIDGNYYLLAGDSTCVPKKVNLGGYGQAEVDLGVIEVEGPALPTVKTSPVQEENISADEAIIGGEVLTDGRLSVSARGICYGKNPDPTIDGLHTSEGSGLGAFTSTLKNLEYNTIYYARAYATNKKGTAYGDQVKFTTEKGVAIVVTDTIINITAHSAKCKGHVESDGGFAVTKRGTCWSKRPDPTIDDDCTDDGSGKGEFTSTIKNLVENTTYYVRTYATNSTKTTYGEQIIITTLDGLAVVKMDSIAAVTSTGFTAYGKVVSDCDLPVSARGFCYALTQYPTLEDDVITIGKGLGTYQGNVRNLQLGTTYYVRAFATNETGTSYSEQIPVTTLDGLATVKTDSIGNVTATSCVAYGNVIFDSYISVTERGFCYATTQYPTLENNHVASGKGKGSYNATISELERNTVYYFRAYAINATGTVYGEQISVKTADGFPTVTTISVQATSLVITGNGNVISDGGYSITDRGICYSTSNSNPTIEDAYASSGLGTGEFEATATNIELDKTYYVRAFATNSVGTSYGQTITVKTGNGLPVVTTTEVGDNISTSGIQSGGEVSDDGGFEITARGVTWGYAPYPVLGEGNYTTDGTGMGYYISLITNITLSSGNLYIRAYATNANGTTYGEQVVVSSEAYGYGTLKTMVYGGYTYKIKFMGRMAWQSGIDACKNMVYGGYNDWFMPNEGEMQGILTLYGVWNGVLRTKSNSAYLVQGCDELWTSKSYSAGMAYYYFLSDDGTMVYDPSTGRTWEEYAWSWDYSQTNKDYVQGVFAVRKYIAQ